MNLWRIAVWGLGIVAVPLALYGLHRLCLWLEAQGHLYYKHRKSEGGGGGPALRELQKILEPQTKHVLHVKEEKRRRSEEDAPGQGDQPAP
jgi:hypothetical protein